MVSSCNPHVTSPILFHIVMSDLSYASSYVSDQLKCCHVSFSSSAVIGASAVTRSSASSSGGTEREVDGIHNSLGESPGGRSSNEGQRVRKLKAMIDAFCLLERQAQVVLVMFSRSMDVPDDRSHTAAGR